MQSILGVRLRVAVDLELAAKLADVEGQSCRTVFSLRCTDHNDRDEIQMSKRTIPTQTLIGGKPTAFRKGAMEI
jgi:hypothetical protein